jgi:transcriptional regulator with XRE-family HTH domain
MKPESVRETLQKERKRQGLTYYKLAQAAGLDIETAKKVELGQDLRFSTLQALCNALSIEIRLITAEERD